MEGSKNFHHEHNLQETFSNGHLIVMVTLLIEQDLRGREKTVRDSSPQPLFLNPKGKARNL